jgi:hypothetical protein
VLDRKRKGPYIEKEGGQRKGAHEGCREVRLREQLWENGLAISSEKKCIQKRKG